MAAITAAILGGAALAGAGIKAYSDYKASKSQAKTAKAASKAQQNVAKQQADNQTEAAQGAVDILGRSTSSAESYLTSAAKKAQTAVDDSYGKSQSYLSDGSNRANNYLGQGYDQSRQSIGQGYSQASNIINQTYRGAENTLGQQYNASRQDLSGGFDQANQSLGTARASLSPVTGLQRYANGATNSIGAYDVVGQQPGNLAGVQGSIGDFSNFQADPGYQFRLQQGLKAVEQNASAHGGRMGGDTLKALNDYAQNTAQQGYQQYVQNKMAVDAQRIGAASTLDANQLSSLYNQAGRTDSANLAAQQNQYGLANVGFGAQGRVSDLYSQQAGLQAQQGAQLSNLSTNFGSQMSGLQAGSGQLQASNSERLGQAQAALTQGYAQGQAGIATNLAGQQSNLAQAYGQQTSNNQTSLGTSMANIQMQGANNQANALTGGAAGAAGTVMQTLPSYSSAVPYAGAGWNAFGNAASSAISNGAYLYAMGSMGGAGGGQQPVPQPGANAANVGAYTPAGPYMPGPVYG